MIKSTSHQERQVDKLSELKTNLEEVTTPIFSGSLRGEDIGNLESSLREYAELNHMEMPTQIESYLLELLEFIPRFEDHLQASSRETYRLATGELKSRLHRLLYALSDEIEDLS